MFIFAVSIWYFMPEETLLNDLAARNSAMIEELKVLKDSVERFEAYMFSSKVRHILFGVSAPIDREKLVPQLSDLIRSKILPVAKKFDVDLGQFLVILKSNKVFSQEKHQRNTIAYAGNALDKSKRVMKYIQDIDALVQLLKQDPVPKPLKGLFHQLKDIFGSVRSDIDDVNTDNSYFEGALRIERHVARNEEWLWSNNLFSGSNWSKMKSGDIWMSFKTKSYLKGEMDSRLISRFTDSQVTHVALFMIDSTGKQCLVHSTLIPHTKKMTPYKIFPASIVPGVMYIVLRPKLTDDQRIQLWSAVRKKVEQKIKFSVKKPFGVALSLILSWLVRMFTARNVSFGNPFKGARNEMFCSEFIDEVFKDAGFLLTPKSRVSNMVFPSDIAASGNVDFVGVAFDPRPIREKRISMAELIEGARI
jgi:hypothetical protein